MSDQRPASKSELMVVAAAHALEGRRVCFVGVGLPNIAVNLAKRTVAPQMELVYEAGVFGANPARLPLSIGDPTIVTGSTATVSMHDLFGLYLQGGRIDVGFLGGAQIETMFPLHLDSLHDFRLTLGDRSIVVKGRVAHCSISDVEEAGRSLGASDLQILVRVILPSILPALLAGTNFVLHAAGWLEGGLASGYEKFVMDADQLGMMQTLTAAYLPAGLTDAIIFSLLFVILLVRPYGLFGKETAGAMRAQR